MAKDFEIPAPDGTILKASAFENPSAPRAICVIVHGMGEHRRRYERVANILAEKGIAVVTYDQRGHGETATKHGDVNGGWPAMIADIDVVRKAALKKLKVDVPVIILGHSMGSMSLQSYLLEHSNDVAGIALSGSTAIDVMAANRVPGQAPDLSAMNAPFAGPNSTGFEWLSRDPAEVAKYVADPACGFGIDLEASNGLFATGATLADPEHLKRIRPDLPIFIFSGDRDPVGGPDGAFLELIGKRYKDAGISKTNVKLYPEGRHEMFNETNRDEVHADLLAWIDSVLA
ncbi:alpha/beta hydrolase fold protein [Hyaloraphidium curvatum]|nr:alpha/beta hydrolase fold protein [Hyaloraphidium curvatum]